jgi:hypothetical protein
MVAMPSTTDLHVASEGDWFWQSRTDNWTPW